MPITSPDAIRTPNPGDPYNLVADWAITATDTQNALLRRANAYSGTSTERTAFTSAPDGILWVDTTAPFRVWQRVSGAWVEPNTRVGSGWITLTGLATGHTASISIGATGQVEIRWESTVALPTGFTTVGTGVIPSTVAGKTARPTMNRFGLAYLAGSNAVVYVTPGGNLTVNNNSGASRANGSGSVIYTP